MPTYVPTYEKVESANERIDRLNREEGWDEVFNKPKTKIVEIPVSSDMTMNELRQEVKKQMSAPVEQEDNALQQLQKARDVIDNKVKAVVGEGLAEEMRVFANGSKRCIDADKYRYDLIPKAALDAIAKTLKLGGDKYGVSNWRDNGGIPVANCINHCLQHVHAFISGDDSEETLETHIAHAATNLCFVLHFLSEGKTYDPKEA
jgi:hypothetical protein